MKDHDVTWLYGPLQPGSSIGKPCRSDDTLRRRRRSNSIRHHQKPILKKRSLSEQMLRKSVSSASLLRQAATAAEAFNIRSESFSAYKSSLFANSALTPPSSYVSEISTPNPNAWKNVRFYELVEQCVAVGNPDDDPSYSFNDLDDVIMMRKMSKQLPKRPSPVAAALNTPPSKTIEKLPHAPLKSPEPSSCGGLGLSYFPAQSDVSPSVESSPVSFEDESEDEEDDWKPPKWPRNRKDSVHLLHDKLDAIKRNVGTSPTSESLCDSRLAITTSLKKGDISPVTALSPEGKISPITFKLTAFSFTSTSDMGTPALSSSSSDAGPPSISNWSAVDPAFNSDDYFSPRSSDPTTHDDDYDWIEAYSPEDVINKHSTLHSNPITPSPFPTRPLGFNAVLLPQYSTVCEKDPVARTSSDSGYGSEQLATLRDTYNGTPEIEKGRAMCDWDLYPGAWDATELEEAVAWSRGF